MKTVNGVEVVNITADEFLIIEQIQIIELSYGLLDSHATFFDAHYPPIPDFRSLQDFDEQLSRGTAQNQDRLVRLRHRHIDDGWKIKVHPG